MRHRAFECDRELGRLVDPRHAALTEPMAVGLHAVNKSAIERGEAALGKAQAAFMTLSGDADSDGADSDDVGTVRSVLEGFRAAPLSADEQARRAGQMLRFLSLVPVEYGRGVRGGTVSVEKLDAVATEKLRFPMRRSTA